jgi:GH24 family phage-related lysozyme (muramidase)
MKISENGLNLIKRFEGCILTAYQDSGGVWTIGYGTTDADKSITGTRITASLRITQEQAENWLRESVDQKYGPEVEKYNNTYHWNQNQFDALVSFAYNIGSIDQLTAKGTRSIQQISEKILEYNRAGGKVLTGLVYRRKLEKQLFDTPVETVDTSVYGWNHDQNGYWYKRSDGTYPVNCWEQIDHHWYLFNKDGYMLVGWQQWNSEKEEIGSGDWYYFDTTPGETMGQCWHEKNGGSGVLEPWYVE